MARKKTEALSKTGKRSSLARSRLTPEQRAEYDTKIRLSKPVAFRLTEADYAAYLAKVQASGLKPSEFFRDAVLTNKTQVVARVQPSDDKRRLIYLFNKASNNLNQLAHTANAAELAGTATPATYAGILAELQTLADVMLEAIRNAD